MKLFVLNAMSLFIVCCRRPRAGKQEAIALDKYLLFCSVVVSCRVRRDWVRKRWWFGYLPSATDESKVKLGPMATSIVTLRNGELMQS